MPTDELDDLYFGFYGHGSVLLAAGLLGYRSHGGGYVPTDNLWRLFERRPDLGRLLPALKEFITAEALERCSYPDCSLRRQWAEDRLREAGITEDGLSMLRLLVSHYARFGAATVAYGELRIG